MASPSELEAEVNRHSNKLDNPSRRRLLKGFLHLGLSSIGLYGTTMYNKNHPGARDGPEQTQDAKNETEKSQVQDSLVKKFAPGILYVASEITPQYLHILDENDAGLMGGMMGFGMTAMIAIKPDNDFAIPIYCATGATILTGRALDLYSTQKFARTVQDSRCREYGFDQFYFEANRMLPAHPKPSDVLSLDQLKDEATKVTLNILAIPVGIQVGMWSAEAFFNNLKNDCLLRLGMQMGDEVKDRLTKGHSDNQIFGYLRAVRDNGIEKAKTYTPT